jgi:HPr kinase/phosphorylase
VTTPVLMHASCVAVSGRAVLITGASGSGKSSLALHLMALGADLVADDQTELTEQTDQTDQTDLTKSEGRITARCPAPLRGLIEARGVGLLRVTPCDSAEIVLVADLDHPEPDRLPPRRKVTLLGCQIDLVLGRGNDHLAAAIHCCLKGTRQA